MHIISYHIISYHFAYCLPKLPNTKNRTICPDTFIKRRAPFVFLQLISWTQTQHDLLLQVSIVEIGSFRRCYVKKRGWVEPQTLRLQPASRTLVRLQWADDDCESLASCRVFSPGIILNIRLWVQLDQCLSCTWPKNQGFNLWYPNDTLNFWYLGPINHRRLLNPLGLKA